MTGRRNLRSGIRGVNAILGLIAIFIFGLFTSVLIYWAPANKALGIGLYIVGTVSSTVPSFYSHPLTILGSYVVTLLALILFLEATFTFKL